MRVISPRPVGLAGYSVALRAWRAVRSWPQHLAPLGRKCAPHLAVAVLIAAYALRFSLLSVAVYDGYGSPGFDMGIFDQGIWLLSRFHAPFVTVMGRDLFGDHTSFILVLLVPIYWVLPYAQVLLVVQACLIAAAGVPIYLLARRRLESTVLATALVGVYLLNPALQNGNLEQFHPECFLVLGIALAIYAAVEWKPSLLLVAVACALLVKEDSALLVAPLGVWVAFRRNRRWGVGIVAACGAYMAFAFEVVIRTILGTATFYTGRLPFGGAGGLIRTALGRPGRLLRYLSRGGRPFYLWQMFVSVGWGFLISPEVAAVAVLTLTEDLVSNFPYMHQIYYHYALPIVPVLVCGSVWGIGALKSVRSRRVATGVVSACALVSCILWGLAPFSLNSYPHLNPAGAQVRDINEVKAALPPHASVSAFYGYIAHVDHRVHAYQWPTPFAAHYWGLYRREGQRLPVASKVDYLMLRTNMTGKDLALFNSIKPHFRLVIRRGDAALYRRIAPAGAHSSATMLPAQGS